MTTTVARPERPAPAAAAASSGMGLRWGLTAPVGRRSDVSLWAVCRRDWEAASGGRCVPPPARGPGRRGGLRHDSVRLALSEGGSRSRGRPWRRLGIGYGDGFVGRRLAVGRRSLGMRRVLKSPGLLSVNRVGAVVSAVLTVDAMCMTSPMCPMRRRFGVVTSCAGTTVRCCDW